MNEKQKLYNALVERNLYSKSFEEFDSQFSSTEKIKGLHSALKDRDLVSISPSSFQSKYFGDLDVTETSGDQRTGNLDIGNTSLSPGVEAPENTSDEPREGSDSTPSLTFPNSGFSGIAQEGGEAIHSILRSGLSGAGQIVESLGTLSDQFRRKFGDLGPRLQIGEGEQAQQSILTNIGQSIQQTAEEIFPNDPDVQDTFINNTVPQALGSTVSYVTAGALGGSAAAAISGGLQMGQQAFTEAKQAGADDDTAMNALLLNMPLGGLEAIPVTRLFSRLNKATGGSVANVLKEGVVGGIEEAVQESTQQFLSNVVAQNLYDESRELIHGMGEGGGAGFAVGFMLNAIGASARNIRNNPNATKEELAAAKKTEALVEEKRESLAQESQEQQVELTREFSRQLEEKFLDPIKIKQDQESEGVSLPNRLDDTSIEGQEGAQRRGRAESREEKSGFDQSFLENIRENTNQFFKSVSNKELRGQAKEFVDNMIDQFGLDQAVESARRVTIENDSPLAIAQRFAIGREVIQRLNENHVQKIEAGDPTATNVSDKKLRFIEDFDAMATDAGRAIQSLNYGSGYMAQDFVRIYERIVNEFKNSDSISVRVRDFFRKKFGKKTREDIEVEQEVVDEITKKASKLKDIPEGQFREEAARDIFRYINDQVPTNLTKLGVAIGYANILSSHETQAVNFGNTGLNVLFDAITLNIANPRATKEIWTGLATGFEKGKTEAKSALKSGKARTGKQRGKGIKEQSPLERLFERIQTKEGDSTAKKVGKIALRPIAALRWVRRIMVASDVLWYKSSEQMRTAVLARDIAKKEGINNQNEISKRVNEILHNTTDLKSRAKAQAKEEGFEGLDLERRASEIVDQNKPDDIKISAQEFANKSRYTQEPEGVLGAASKGVELISKKVPPLKMAVPFTRVVANVANNLIDYSPLGYTRLFAATKWGQKIKNVPEGDLWWQQAAKSTFGAFMTMIPAIINSVNFDDDDPFIYFHGRGPQNFKDRYQLQETGWKEYSLQIGDRFFSFKETIFALPLAAVGNYFDAVKYDDLDEEDVIGRVAFVMNNSPRVILDQSFLTGLSDLFTALSSERLVDDTSPVKTVIDKVRPFAFPNLIRKIDQTFDPRITTSDNIKESLARDIPFVRTRVGKPILNVLGEPIRQDYSFSDRIAKRFFSTHKSDPVWNTIVEKNAFISTPSQSGTKITDRNGDVRDMNPTEFYNFTIIRGRNIKRTLRVNLSRIRRMSPGDAQKFVNKISANATESAKTELKKRGLVGNDRILEPNK